MLKFTIYSALTAPITHHILTSMSNTVDKIRVKNTFHNLYEWTSCLDSTDRVVEWKMHLICSLTQRSDMSHAKEQARYKLCMPRSLSKNPT